MPVQPPTLRRGLWGLYAAACLSLLCTLTLPYVGEEAVYTITSLEMRLSGDYFVTTLYGGNYGRPPLINWLIIAVANSLGWDNVLLASRLVNAGATVATGLVLAWFVMHLTRNGAFAVFVAAVLLSGDMLMYRGWLAYSDSVFTFFVFASIACAWLGAYERRPLLIWLAVAAVTCGALTKVQTAYLFYGVAVAVLCARREYRREFFGMNSIAAHSAAALVLVAWHALAARGTQSMSTLVDILHKATTVDPLMHVLQVLSFPLETAARFLPAAGIAIYYAWRARRGAGEERAVAPLAGLTLTAVVWMAAVNYLPYWLGPKSHIRYIMPLYPLFALLIAHALWRAGERPVAVAIRWLAAAVALKFALALWAFPVYQAKYRGDYPAVASDIIHRTRGYALYAADVSATGLSVAAHINQLRFPGAALRWPHEVWDDGFVLAYRPDPALGRIAHRYQLGRNYLFLLCRGAACGN